MHIPETVKEHPYAWGIGAGVVVVLLVYWLFKPSQAAASGGSDYLGAYYAAEAQAAVAGNQAQAIATQAATQVNLAKIQSDTDKAAIAAGVQIAGLQADVVNQQTGAQAALGSQGIAAQLLTNSGNFILGQMLITGGAAPAGGLWGYGSIPKQIGGDPSSYYDPASGKIFNIVNGQTIVGTGVGTA